MNETSTHDAVHIDAVAAANAAIDSCYVATKAALAARDSVYDARKAYVSARNAYDDALDKAYAASGKAFKAAGTDAYEDASAAFLTAYAELYYARCAYAATLDAALDAGRPTTATEENPQMSYLSLEKRIALAETRAEFLNASQDYCVKEINAVIKSLKERASILRHDANDLSDKASMLSDEVRRRAEQMEARILSTTDDDLK